MKKTISSFVVLFSLSIFSYSQNSSFDGSVILEDGNEKEVTVSLQSNRGFTSVKVYDSEANDIEYYIGQIKEIRLSDGRVLLTNQIEFNKNLNESDRKKVYMEEIINGKISLYRLYDVELKYGIYFQGSYKALQSIRENGFENGLYKSEFYRISNIGQCELVSEIQSLKFSEIRFIYLTNKINNCFDEDYIPQEIERKEKKKHELGFRIGSTFSSIDFIANEGNERYENELEFNYSVGLNIGIDFNPSIIGEWLFINSGIEYRGYTFKGNESNGIRYSNEMKFGEFILNGGVEFRKEFNGFNFAISGGRGFHFERKSKKINRVNITYDFVRNDGNVFPTTDEIFTTDYMNSKYFTWYVSPSIFREIKKDVLAGIKIKSIYRSNEVATAKSDIHSDDFNFDYSLNVFVRFRFF
ncbi:MAG TPA: hypothetical protein DF712_13420 [Balneola sp.]|jgi:hypothetical protein|nr:hypothetical protein [Bacteroidota bacterium]MAC04639.1 hypothetical protein [Balneola sp.]MAO76804.1 hypothetical protein [Balneola sp.]MBF64961.1 hypothetical protein [Balneola sp.]HAH51728.1 hypothetical protein [Balneola sp.]|tara:strand:+ start:3976 stop:5211 length:1236 start_codon:yes stop_codon:yes gene_type:complete